MADVAMPPGDGEFDRGERLLGGDDDDASCGLQGKKLDGHEDLDDCETTYDPTASTATSMSWVSSDVSGASQSLSGTSFRADFGSGSQSLGPSASWKPSSDIARRVSVVKEEHDEDGTPKEEESLGAPPGLATSAQATVPVSLNASVLPSKGSVTHGSGNCRPCAWFWKQQGCSNGDDCRHCHLCPEGEIKTRKKTKVDTMRKDKQDGEPDDEQEEQEQDGSGEGPQFIPPGLPLVPPPGLGLIAPTHDPLAPMTVSLDPAAPSYDSIPSVGSSQHASGDCRPCAWFWKAAGCSNGKDCRHCHLCPDGEIKNRKKDKVDTMRSEKSMDSNASPKHNSQSQSSPQQPQQLADDGEDCPGSSLHGTGHCRPCAWFWKPQGCQNGEECRHCHLCPEGEIKNRRKEKVANLREQDDIIGRQHDPRMMAMDMSMWAGEQSPFMPLMDPSLMMPNPFMMPMMPTMPMDIPGMSPLSFPSTGSSLHVLGKCKPCAWFWKPTGCMNGQECAHCHLCTAGELKTRKRVKEAAMRLGALTPVHS